MMVGLMAERFVLEIPERSEMDHIPVAASCPVQQLNRARIDGRRGQLDLGV
jgi:hypothetical protein